MFKYILFDFDGTLVDTNDLVIDSLQETSKKFIGRKLSNDELNSILGKYLEEQMKLISEPDYKEMVSFYRQYYKTYQDDRIKEFPGIRQTLQELRNLDCKMAVVSAKGRGGIKHGLELFGISDFIDVIVSAYDIQNNKPHPEPAQKALSAFGASPDEAILVGDSPYDILCGKNAGIKTVLVGWTIFPKEDILKYEPDFCIKTPFELIEIVSDQK